MIEQIYLYFSIEMIYFWLNLGVIPFWLILIFFPQSQICKIFTTSIFPIFALSLVYGYLFYYAFHDNYSFLSNFDLYLGLDKLSDLFNNSLFLMMFWVHFLTINLFCGSWMVKDSQKFGMNKIIMFFPLIITYLIGPIGVFLYWVFRLFYAKRINLYD